MQSIPLREEVQNAGPAKFYAVLFTDTKSPRRQDCSDEKRKEKRERQEVVGEEEKASS